jgi:uncharacterized membrane protein (UPF0127 family)
MKKLTKQILVINASKEKQLVSDLEIAESFMTRLIGLMGRASFPNGKGLWIKGSGNSIHTFFMRVPIDLIFVNKEKKVKYLVHNMKPWKIVVVPTLERTDCLELPAGTIAETGTTLGDILRVEA